MKRSLYRWIGLALSLVLWCTALAGNGWAQGALVKVDPPSGAVAVGATVSINLRIENVTALYGAAVNLSFNPALLEVVDADSGKDGVQIQPGTFPPPDFVQQAVDPAAGKITYIVTAVSPSEPVNGSGTLATITFKGKADGVSAITIDNVQLSTKDGAPIAAGKQDGSIAVGSGTNIPPTNTPPPTATAVPPTPTAAPGATATPLPTPFPTPASPGQILGYHTVKAGETLYCIGRAYQVDPYAIARQNNIVNPSLLRVGQQLAIPNAPRALPAGYTCPRQFGPGSPPPPPPPATCRWQHTVAAGENLYRISLRYGVNMYTIAQANRITNLNYIRVGQVLCIP